MPHSFFTTAVVRVSIPPELASEAALLAHLGLSADELRKIWWFRDRMYHEFEIAKGKGKSRQISAPNDRIKHLQRKIAPLLDQIYRVRNCVHGFVAGRSVKTNANSHLRKRFVINLDLKHFFPSITENRVAGVLRSLNIDRRVSEIIARLCCYQYHLPQGAPTSPVISNMICFRLDKGLLAFAKSTHCIYTRYADDLTLSSYRPMAALFGGALPAPGHFPTELLAEGLTNIFIENGVTINHKKTHYADRRSRKVVTGIKINEILNVDRRYVRNIRAALYSRETLGRKAAQHKFEKSFGGTSHLSEHLKGKISWLRHIRGQTDPVFRALAIRFNASFPERAIEVAPTVEELRDRSVWVVEHAASFETMSQGSAFFLKDVGLVTAAHCVDGVDDVELYHPAKPANKFKAKVLHRHVERDIAILGHAISPTEYFELQHSANAVTRGDILSAVGYPSFGPGDTINVREGTVSSLLVKHAVNLIEVTQQLTQGMSGGPVLTSDNAVAGIIHKGGPSEGRNFVIHIKELDACLAEWRPT